MYWFHLFIQQTLTKFNSLFLYWCDKTPFPKGSWRGKGLFGLQITVHHPGKLWCQLKEKLEGRKGSRNPGAYWLISSAFLMYLRPPCVGMAPPMVIWVLPHQLAMEKMASVTHSDLLNAKGLGQCRVCSAAIHSTHRWSIRLRAAPLHIWHCPRRSSHCPAISNMRGRVCTVTEASPSPMASPDFFRAPVLPTSTTAQLLPRPDPSILGLPQQSRLYFNQ